MGRKWKIVWPEHKMISDAAIISLAKDAIDCGNLVEIKNQNDAVECANALDQAGIITVGIENDN